MIDVANELNQMSCPQTGQNQEGHANIDVSAFEEFKAEDVIPMFHGKEYSPSHEVKHEQPVHRLMCQMLAQGYTVEEVADECAVHASTVRNIKKQPWAQKYIAEFMDRAGQKAVMKQLHSGVSNAVQMLLKSVDPENPLKLKPEHQAKAGHDFLTRLYGAAPQKVVHTNEDAENLTMEQLKAVALGRD